MKDGLYHYKVFWPFGELRPVFSLVPSKHAIHRALELNVNMPRHFLPRASKVFEIEVKAGEIFKIGARQKMDEGRDVCFVFDTDSKVIRTVWINLAKDNHFTLNKGVYVRG